MFKRTFDSKRLNLPNTFKRRRHYHMCVNRDNIKYIYFISVMGKIK